MDAEGVLIANLETILHDAFVRKQPKMTATLLDLLRLGEPEERILRMLRNFVAMQGIDPAVSWLYCMAEGFVHIEAKKRAREGGHRG